MKVTPPSKISLHIIWWPSKILIVLMTRSHTGLNLMLIIPESSHPNIATSLIDINVKFFHVNKHSII